MRYPAAETEQKHTRILQTAIRLFRERGFNKVSVNEIMTAAGLTHGPFYNHFDSKQALIAECVEHDLTNALGCQRFPQTAKGKAAYVDFYLAAEHRDDPSGGCTFSALASEVRQTPEAQSAYTRQLKAFIDRLSSYFPWPSKRTARAESIRLLASLVGAVVLARAVDDPRFSDEILREVRRGALKE